MLRAQQFLLTAALVTLAGFTLAQDDPKTVQDDWVAPAGPDNSTVVDVGEEYRITWTSTLWQWFASYAPSADVRNVDLWITGYYQHQFAHLVAERVQVNRSLQSIWRVDVPSDELTATPYWVFRFLPSGVTFSETADSISSPGFMIVNASATVTSTTTSSSTSSSPTEFRFTSTEASHLPTASTAATSLSTPSVAPTASTNKGLSTGAIAGIVVGAVLGAAAFLGLGWLLARRRRDSSTISPPTLARHPSKVYPEVTTIRQNEKYPSSNTQPHGRTEPPMFELGHHSSDTRYGLPAELHG